jgi:cystathionine beta-lyase
VDAFAGFSCGFLPASIWFKKENNLKGKNLMLSKNFEVNCLEDGDIHVRNLALGDGVAECLNGKPFFLLLLLLFEFTGIMKSILLFAEIEIKKLSISTKLMNFENEFDPYGAMSTPLYHTITFKQVML